MLVAFTRITAVDIKQCESLTRFWRLSYIVANNLDMKCEGERSQRYLGIGPRVGDSHCFSSFPQRRPSLLPLTFVSQCTLLLPLWPFQISSWLSFFIYIFSKHHPTAYLSAQQSGHILCSSDFCLLSPVDLKHYEIRTTVSKWHISNTQPKKGYVTH